MTRPPVAGSVSPTLSPVPGERKAGGAATDTAYAVVMQELPVLPAGCSLDDVELRVQIDRYREVGKHGTVRVSDPRLLVVALSDDVPDGLVHELMAVERSCCPFFELSWRPAARELSIAVSKAEHEPALAGIALAIAPADVAT